MLKVYVPFSLAICEEKIRNAASEEVVSTFRSLGLFQPLKGASIEAFEVFVLVTKFTQRRSHTHNMMLDRRELFEGSQGEVLLGSFLEWVWTRVCSSTMDLGSFLRKYVNN